MGAFTAFRLSLPKSQLKAGSAMTAALISRIASGRLGGDFVGPQLVAGGVLGPAEAQFGCARQIGNAAEGRQPGIASS